MSIPRNIYLADGLQGNALIVYIKEHQNSMMLATTQLGKYLLAGGILGPALLNFTRYAKRLERRLGAAEAVLRAHGLYLNDDHEACRVDAECTQSAPTSFQLPTPETFGSVEHRDAAMDHIGPISDGMSEHDTIEGANLNNEVMDINTTTRGFEYHGQTSSIAFLERLRSFTEPSVPTPSSTPPVMISAQWPAISGRSLVTDFHNDSFIQQEEAPPWVCEKIEDEFFPLQAYTFIEAYFSHQHYVHPIVDKEPFLCLCRKLWEGQSRDTTRSFQAMYFALLALGALTRTWNEESISGKGRYEWTLLLFRKAEVALGRPGAFPNLLTIQALLIMAKICQYQLDLNFAYTYLGLGIRTALTCGINRLTVFRVKDIPKDSPSLMVARTWWALYALEIELSFALGRPDTLGLDFHHNRPVPRMNDSESDIIHATLDLSMIIRDVSSGVHLSAVKLPDRIHQAKKLEGRLDDWLAQLPDKIRPTLGTDVLSSGSIRDQQWTKLQMFVLNIRQSYFLLKQKQLFAKWLQGIFML